MSWRFFNDYQPWNDARRLFVMRVDERDRTRAIVKTLTLEAVVDGVKIEDATITDSFGGEDVRGFLQGALEAAWEMGLRPAGFESHDSELKAVRYHLEDMRALAKVPRQTTA